MSCCGPNCAASRRTPSRFRIRCDASWKIISKFSATSTQKTICEKFDGRDRLICNSLFSWANDGSHYAMDDLYVSLEPGAIDAYLVVFEQVFVRMGHGPHYKMMIGRE